MKRQISMSKIDIVKGLSAADPKRSKPSKKVSFGVKKLEDAPGEFGKSSLCQGGVSWNDSNEQG